MLGLISGYVESGDEDAGLEDVIIEGSAAGLFMGVLAAVAVSMGGSGIVEYTSLHGVLFFEAISDFVTLTGAGAIKTGVVVGALTLLDAVIPGYIGGMFIHGAQEELSE